MYELAIYEKEFEMCNMMLESALSDFTCFEWFSEDVSLESDAGIFLESGTGERAIDKIIASIQKLFQSFLQFIKNLFKKKDKDIKEVEDAVKKDPKLKNKKVKKKDYAKLEKLSDDTQRIILDVRNKEELDRQMMKYRKERRRLIAKGTVITIGLGTAIYLLNKSKNEKIAKLQSDLDNTNREYKKIKVHYKNKKEKFNTAYGKLKMENESLKNEIEVMKAKTAAEKKRVKKGQNVRKMNIKTAKLRGSAEGSALIIKAKTEVIKDTINDVKEDIAESVKTIINPEKNIIETVKALKEVPKTVTGVKSTVKKNMDENLDKKIAEKEKKIDKLKEDEPRARKTLDNPKASPKSKRAASEFLKKYDERLADLTRTLGVLQKQKEEQET